MLSILAVLVGPKRFHLSLGRRPLYRNPRAAFTSKPEEARRFVFVAPQNRILSGIEIGLATTYTSKGYFDNQMHTGRVGVTRYFNGGTDQFFLP